ncbi:MAG: hypothetical protein H6739_06935 [Alphaproteobacteria bacterium]|nr:hypothetical protein [Alphaproteobacteria bacterium]
MTTRAQPTSGNRFVRAARPCARTDASAQRLRRLHVRAALYASPETLCTAKEFAGVMGLREATARKLQPASLRPVGRSKRAPFRCWLAALDGEPVVHDAVPIEHPTPQRSRRPKRSTSRSLTPLGGPARR